MDITEVTVVHHAALVLLLLWAAASLGWCHPLLFVLSLLYLLVVNERYRVRLQKRVQFEEKKYDSQRRLLSDSESLRWLTYAVEKLWPICIEKIASQQFLLPTIPWFLDKYKPWIAGKAVVEHLYLGRNPPMFTGVRVLGQSSDDDHLVLELGMAFLSADDMSAILAVQLIKELGFGIWAKLHLTSMHVEGKVLVGVKFLRGWPFLGRIRFCFVEPPYFQMTVKPLFNHGLDVTEFPGIAGWLDKLLGVALEQTLVEPNMLVIDAEKIASVPTERWFNVHERHPIAIAKVEVIEGADMKPSDINGLADPYLKGRLGSYKFRTKIQRKTLSPKWIEEFNIPITSWEVPNVLVIEIRDKDPIFDDLLGGCSIDIGNLKGGQRHDKWLTLQNVKMGRLHVAVTVLEGEYKGKETSIDGKEEQSKGSEIGTPESTPRCQDNSDVFLDDENRKMSDEFEPINIEGLDNVAVWVHRPGGCIAQTWESRKGRGRRPETHLHREGNKTVNSPSSSGDYIDVDEGSRRGAFRRGLQKLSHSFQKTQKQENPQNDESMPSPRRTARDGKSEMVEISSPRKGHMRDMAKNIMGHAGKSTRNLKSVLSRKCVKDEEASESLDSKDSLG